MIGEFIFVNQLAAYKLFGKNKSPGKIKSDHFVGNFYSMFGKKEKTNSKIRIRIS